MPDTALTRAQLFSQADAALYAAKHAGKNQTVRYSQMIAEGAPVSVRN